MKKLLIIADDFGLSESVNKGIFECCENNIVTGVSVMSTGAAFDDIHYLIEKYPNIDIGLHFDLISTRLLSDLQINYSPINLAIRLNFDKKLLEAIRKELILQINKLMKITQIKHIDSHRHIHYIPQIFKIVNDIADELAIARVRVPCPKIKFNGLKFMFYRRDFFKFLPFFIFKFFNK
ncbi:MAG TPA: ChbG/HpnK family deacetylase, partial [bacterium]|nr:ChbG/HpnK family deacetylase [bacterium]